MRQAMLALAMAACGSGTTTSTLALATFCDEVFLCYGFSDSQQCQDNWFDPDDQGATCADEAKYLDCVNPCVEELGCGPELDGCEFDCFNKHCNDAI